jgi:hypothetical protein
MKNKNKIFLIISLLLMPVMVFAKSVGDGMDISEAISTELFVSLHMSIFVLLPLSAMLFKSNKIKGFITLFAIRAAILLFFDFFVTPQIAMVDFFAVFIGAFIVVPIVAIYTKAFTRLIPQMTDDRTAIKSIKAKVDAIELKCAKCNSPLKITDKFCAKCGAPFDGDNVVVSENPNASVTVPPKKAVHLADFDKMYSLNEDKMLEEFINRELKKAGFEDSSSLIQSDILKRKNIMNIIFSLLVFIYITLIFFHFPMYTYIIGVIILFIYFKSTKKYNLIAYLKKQVQARPNEKISNIVMNAKSNLVNNNSSVIFTISLLIAVATPLIIFSSPRIIYEKTDNGYAVRYYIFGLTNFKTANIPSTYKNEDVVTLRGNTFSNMPFLESVNLPDTITEIRGQAFKNCNKLIEVNIPKNLEYLGGGAFYNAKSLKSIDLPDTLTYLGGESFYGASSLVEVKLSENLTEIRGDSFEYCTSLQSIKIPDKVTRIGGHAFYGDTFLSEVIISEDSMLGEIGSSAFRQCSSLYKITIPTGVQINSRAFKESPTCIQTYGQDLPDECLHYYSE